MRFLGEMNVFGQENYWDCVQEVICVWQNFVKMEDEFLELFKKFEYGDMLIILVLEKQKQEGFEVLQGS